MPVGTLPATMGGQSKTQPIRLLAMTDDELKALVAGLAVSQDRTDAQLAKTDAQLAKTDAQLAKTDAKLDRLAEMHRSVSEDVARTAAKVDRLAEMYGGVGNNQGAVAEEFYFNTLKANPVLGGVRFDYVQRNAERTGAGVANEFDLLLINGRTVYVVEVKYKAHEKDLRRLLDVKAVNFPRLFPEYADHEQHFALATFHIHDELKDAALEQGVTVLQRKGDLIESIAA